MQKARLLVQARRWQDAEVALREVLAQHPNKGEGHSLLALALFQLNRYQEGETEALLGVQLAPQDEYSHYILGYLYFYRNKLEDAHASVRTALTIDPNQTRLHRLLAEIYVKELKWDKALEAVHRALDINPHDVIALNLLAAIDRRLGRWDEAEAALQSALTVQPNKGLSHANLGWFKLAHAEYDAAIGYFREALRLEPEANTARDGLAQAMKLRSRLYREAYHFFRVASDPQGVTEPTNQAFLAIVGGLVALGLVILVDETGRENWMPLPFVIYIGFLWMTWSAPTTFDLLLRFRRHDRLIFTRRRWMATHTLLAAIGLAVALGGAGWLVGGERQLALSLAAVEVLALGLAVVGTFTVHSPRNGVVLFMITLGLTLIWIISLVVGLALASPNLFDYIFGVGFLLYLQADESANADDTPRILW